MQLARKQFKVRMDSLSFSLEGRGSTETLEEDKELSLAQLEEKDTKTEAVAGRSVDNIYGKTGAVQLVRAGSDKKACDYDTLAEDQEYIKEIKELHAYLDTVKTMVMRPGCSPEVMKIALNSMSTLFNTLTFVSSVTRPRASL